MSNLDVIQAAIAKRREEYERERAKAAKKTGFQAKMSARGNGDDEIKSMLAEFDLLYLIQADTGEAGSASGERIDFHECPVCGHRDCFSYYSDTNSWCCFSENNETGYDGGTALEYFKATRTDDDTEAVKWLREETGHPYEREQADEAQGGEGTGEQADPSKWQLREPEAATVGTPSKRAPVIWQGILRRGHVAVLVGKGKVGKTQTVLEIAAIHAEGGGELFGHELAGGRSLVVNPEVDPRSFRDRLNGVCKGRDAATINANMEIIHLRGVKGASLKKLACDLRNHYKRGDYSLIVLDSVAAYFEGNENESPDVRKFLTEIEILAHDLDAAIIVVWHTGKALDGDRGAADRARGASAWLDTPDALLTLSEIHPPSNEPSDYLGEGVYACEFEAGGLREFPRFKPVHVLFDYPVHRPDERGITDDWKPNSSQRSGGKSTAELNKARAEAEAAKNEAALLAYFYANQIGEEGMLAPDAAKALGIDGRSVTKLVDLSEHFELVQVSTRKRYVRAVSAPRASSEQTTLDGD